MTTTQPQKRTVRVIVLALAVLTLVVGCSSAPTPPPGPATPTLAVAHIGGADGAVSVFTTTGATSDMNLTHAFELDGGHMTYSAVFGPDGDVYVSNFATGTIAIVAIDDATSGANASTVVSAPARVFSSPDVIAPSAMAFDSRGDLWVADQRNPDPTAIGPNRIVRIADPSGIADGASVPAATIIDIAERPEGMFVQRLVYSLYIDDLDRLWYVDYMSWSVSRLDDLANRGAHETNVAPDMQMITWDPNDPEDTTNVVNPVGITMSDSGSLYLGSLNGDYVYRFDGASAWTGFTIDKTPDAYLSVGVAKARFVAIDDQGALWVLSNVDRKLVRVVGHEAGTGVTTLAPTRSLTWGTFGAVFGGGMSFAAP